MTLQSVKLWAISVGKFCMHITVVVIIQCWQHGKTNMEDSNRSKDIQCKDREIGHSLESIQAKLK